MLYSLLYLASLFYACVQAQDQFDWSSITPSKQLNWTPCYSAFQCTRLSVPLNYSEPNGPEAAIAVIRYQAKPQPPAFPYRGPVLLNPGGPGGSGVDFVLEFAQLATSIVGPSFDVVSFDPRGVSRTTPGVSFLQTDAARGFYNFQPSGATVDATSPSFDIPRQWAQAQALGQLAKDSDSANILPFVTTDNVARDMWSIVQAFNLPDPKLQYFGISYGTVLGATFASLFPDKVGRMVLDGVVPMDAWFAGEYTNELLTTDKDLQTFFDGCFKAGPSICPFYAPSSIKIAQRLDSLLNSVHKQPVAVYTKPYGVVDYATVKSAIFSALYTPYASFIPLAQGLKDIESGNGTTILNLSGVPAATQCNAPPDNSQDAQIAIMCSDANPRHRTPADFETYYQANSGISRFVDFAVGLMIRCSGWQVHPTHFAGPVGGNTSFPILLIGNTADPVTPLKAAMKTSSAFPQSVVLTQDSPGHTSFAATSSCTFGYIAQYFVNGTLPKKGTVCPVDVQLFTPVNSTINLSNAIVKRPGRIW